MPNIIIPKKSSVPGKAPTASQLATGELALNLKDGTLYFKDDVGVVKTLAMAMLLDSGVTAGTYGSTTIVPRFTVDAKGRVTAVTNQTIAFPVTSVFGRTGAVTLGSSDVTTALGFSPANASGANASGTWNNAADRLFLADTRGVNEAPADFSSGVHFDFKSNTTNGLADGGTYNGVLTLRKWGTSTDSSGGVVSQLGFTDNGNLWIRSGAPGGSWDAWKRVITSDGTGASGTWGISITGQAGSLAGFVNSNINNPVNADNVTTNGISYVNAASNLFGQTDGALYSQAYNANWVAEIFQDYRSGQLAIRGKNNGAWNSWRTVLDSTNYQQFTHSFSSLTGKPTTTEGYGITDGFIYRGSIGDGQEDVEVRPGFFSVTRGASAYTDLLINFPAVGSAAGLQLMAHYGDDLWFRVARDSQTNWDGMGSRARRVLNTGTDTYAAAMNQHVRTSDSPTFLAVTAGAFNGSLSGNANTATKLATARTINGVAFDGSANISVSEWHCSGRDFTNGTLITTSIDYSVSNGEPWILEIKGNSYNSGVPFDLQIQGYIYGSTLINYGGYSNGTNISGMVALNDGGKLCFWFPRQEYWQGFTVKAYVAYPGVQPNRVTATSNVSMPAGATKVVQLSPNIRQSIHSGNYANYPSAKLATARTISLSGAATGSGSFDGSSNLNIALTTGDTDYGTL